MKRLRNWWRRSPALALLPVAALMITSSTASAGNGAGAEAASLAANAKQVAVGSTVKLRGRFAPGQAPAPVAAAVPAPGGEQAPAAPASSQFVRIEFRPSGDGHWREARLVQTDRKGRFVRSLRVRRSGSFRAVSADGRSTEPIRVRARARVRARVAARTARLGDRVAIKGTVVPGAGREVVVTVGDDVIKTRSDRSGAFEAEWSANRVGAEAARAKVKGDRVAAGAAANAGKVTVLRPAVASWYGPGLYGNRTGCGQTLTTTIVGVAHKTLPCGAKLTISYGNRTIQANVIDRGPYAGDREFDLTSATREKLGFGDIGTIWVSK